MSRKILKVLISILFLIVAAVAAILSIKSFFPELLEQQKEKYGVGPIMETHARKTPAFKKDVQGNNNEVKPVVVTRPIPEDRHLRKYGVAPIENSAFITYQDKDDLTDKYGVVPVSEFDGLSDDLKKDLKGE